MRICALFSRGLAVALFLSLIPVGAFSAQKITAGGTCKLAKQQVTYGEKIYTCTKSGNKLLWNKGVAVKKPTPTPTLSFPVSGSDLLLAADDCRLSDSSGNNFHLGFPMTPIIKDLSRIRIFAIPFEFTDSKNYRISKDQTSKMFESVASYYLQESQGKTKLDFIFPSVQGSLEQIDTLSLGVKAEESPLTKQFRSLDFTLYINQLLSKTPKSWNLDSYDAVVLYSQDSRTFNFLGGQGWRGTEKSTIGQLPFDSPSGKIRSLVFASAISTVMAHELGHSLFGFIDLYDLSGQGQGQSFAQGWGLMAAAFSGEMNIRGWEKWLAGWLSPEEIRCTKSETTHFLDFIPSQSGSPKLLIYPLDNQRAVVVEAIDTDLIAMENKVPLIVFCNKSSSCQKYNRKGLLAYTVDVTKLSALGVIVVPEALKFPKILIDNTFVSISEVIVRNLGCNTKGCFVSIGR